MILDAFNTVNSPEALFPPHIWLIVFVVMLYFLPGCLHLFPILFAPSPQISILWFLVIIQGDGSSDLSRLATIVSLLYSSLHYSSLQIFLLLQPYSLSLLNIWYQSHITELKNNLLSIGQLQEKQLAILIKHDKCRVYHPKKGLIMQSQMSSNRIFPILVIVITPMGSCLQATSEDVTNLWHCRYGHLSLKGLKTLVSMEMVKGLPALNDSLKVCQDCMKGKQHRETLPKKSLWRASKKLQLVHADICGPISPQSNSGKRYIITFIDDYSRKTWAYFLIHKSEALSIFKKYKVSVEKESGERISCLRTDRGGEFTSSEFNDFCSTHGIKRQLTTAYTPQQNGVAERKNRTIMNMVRSMLLGKELPKQFWAEAVNWSIYVINRSPTTAVPNTTPEEAWSNRKPSVECFRVFGCVAYAHIPG